MNVNVLSVKINKCTDKQRKKLKINWDKFNKLQPYKDKKEIKNRPTTYIGVVNGD